MSLAAAKGKRKVHTDASALPRDFMQFVAKILAVILCGSLRGKLIFRAPVFRLIGRLFGYGKGPHSSFPAFGTLLVNLIYSIVSLSMTRKHALY